MKIANYRNPLTQFIKTVTLSFSRKELLYDITNYSYVEGDVMQAQTEHDRHQVMDIGEDGNVDRVTRVLDLAYSECVELLYPYSKVLCDDEQANDDALKETDTYVINLHVPDSFSKTSADYLEKLIHEYLVYRVLSDWMSITNPTSKDRWLEKLYDIEEKIQSCIVARCHRLRRTQTPF